MAFVFWKELEEIYEDVKKSGKYIAAVRQVNHTYLSKQSKDWQQICKQKSVI